MASLYDEMADVVAEILSDPDFKQGTVYLVHYTKGTPPTDTPWIPGTDTSSNVELDSVTRHVDNKYVDGTTILATDRQVTFAVPTVVPNYYDKLQVDGEVFEIKMLIRIPAAGTVVAYSAVIDK